MAPAAASDGEASGSDARAALSEVRAMHRRAADDQAAIQPGDSVLLIVEDDPHFAGILVDVAREKGFKAVVAEHAEAALAAVRRFRPAAITLDMNLPGITGLALLDRLKNQPEMRHIPVQIVSVSDALPRAERRGALRPLQKPVERDAVEAGIDRARGLATRETKRLLVIEDDEIQRGLVEELVGGDDVEVVAVGTGEAGLEALQESSFDCVVMDLSLPDMGGLEFIERVRGELALEDLPLIVHTGRDLQPDEVSRLHTLAEAVVVQGVEAFDRLLDESALYLHRDESRLSATQRERIERRHRPEAALAGRKVLIVDDDVRNIFALQSLLEGHKMTVVYAEGGREGIKMLQDADDVDVVLMDIMMPGMDGYQATRAIREIERFRDLPIIAVTARAMQGDREKCLAAGASDYITKPVNVDQLVSLLRVWVGRRQP
jgi:CheY-like chemotaxis protein